MLSFTRRIVQVSKWRSCYALRWHRYASNDAVSTPQQDSFLRKRVFGIAAHIDAGKTTTSEAILNASGSLRKGMGRVDSGDTALDYLPAERERGITIQSASATFEWRGHRVFLVDSPGHLDFTFEVERALHVMDSVIVVIDAVAGVQPQTETVWRQADRAALPRLLLVNKMDRDGARLSEVVAEVENHFDVRAPLLHYPLYDDNGTFRGVVNLVDADFATDPRVVAAREKLVETMADLDDDVMTYYLDEVVVPPDVLVSAIRAACKRRDVVPVCCAAALKDIGVNELLDALVDFLPSPIERPCVIGKTVNGTQTLENDPHGPFIAQAFKVTHDNHRGRVVHFRAFSGMLSSRKHPIWNASKQKKERPTKWLHLLADQYIEKDVIEFGDVFSMVGLRHTETGDTISCATTASPAVELVLEGMIIPPAVCSVAIETDTPSAQRQLEEFLSCRLAEDPSLSLTRDEHTGEMLLSGVGELHLECITDRARSELPIDLHVSRPRVAYRETITSPIDHNEVYDAQIGSAHLVARLTIELKPSVDQTSPNVVSVEGDWNRSQLDAIHGGVLAGLSRGSLCGLPTQGITVLIRAANGDSGIACTYSDAALRACGSRGVRKALDLAHPIVVEPMMHVEVDVPDVHQRDVMSEIVHPVRSRGRVESCEPLHWGADSNKYVRISATVPLDGMIGWAKKMRSLCKGRGTFSMSLEQYEPAPRNVIESLKIR